MRLTFSPARLHARLGKSRTMCGRMALGNDSAPNDGVHGVAPERWHEVTCRSCKQSINKYMRERDGS